MAETSFSFKDTLNMLARAKWNRTRRPSDAAGELPQTPLGSEFLDNTQQRLGAVHGTPTIPSPHSPLNTSRGSESRRETQSRSRTASNVSNGSREDPDAYPRQRLHRTAGDALGYSPPSTLARASLGAPRAGEVARSSSLGSYDTRERPRLTRAHADPHQASLNASWDASSQRAPVRATTAEAAPAATDAASMADTVAESARGSRRGHGRSSSLDFSQLLTHAVPHPPDASLRAARPVSGSRPTSASRERSDGSTRLWADRAPTPGSARESPSIRRASQVLLTASPRPPSARQHPRSPTTPLAASPPPRDDVLVVEDYSSSECSSDDEAFANPFDVDQSNCPDVYPLTQVQQGLLRQPSASRAIVHALRLPAADLDSIQRHLHTLVQHHAMLRTRIETSRGRALGRTASPDETPCPPVDVVDIRDEDDVNSLLAVEQSREFDLVELPLLHATLARLPSGEVFTVVSFPAVVGDAWSGMLLARQLVGLLLGEAAPAAPAVEFAQIAMREATTLSGGPATLRRLRAYWQRHLGQHPMLLATAARAEDRLRAEGGPEHPLSTRFRISRSQVGAFHDMLVLPHGRVAPADITMLLCLCGWLVALQQQLGPADFVVGLVLSLRDVQPGGSEGLFAPLTATLPLRVRMSRCRSFVDLLTEVSRCISRARTHMMDPAAAAAACTPATTAGQAVATHNVQFEYFRQRDVAHLAMAGFPNEFLFSDSLDSFPACRSLPPPPPGPPLLQVRMWESPDSCRRVWGQAHHDPHLPCDMAALLDTVRFVVREASCEPHVTLARLSVRLAHRGTGSRPASRPASAGRTHAE